MTVNDGHKRPPTVQAMCGAQYTGIVTARQIDTSKCTGREKRHLARHEFRVCEPPNAPLAVEAQPPIPNPQFSVICYNARCLPPTVIGGLSQGRKR
jgi:hypothetical protein